MPATKKAGTIAILNSDGSPGGRLSKDKYDAVKKVLLTVTPRSADGIAFRDLAKHVQRALPTSMLPAKGSASWLATTVKLDLEGRGLIERIPGVTPQRLRRVKP